MSARPGTRQSAASVAGSVPSAGAGCVGVVESAVLIVGIYRPRSGLTWAVGAPCGMWLMTR